MARGKRVLFVCEKRAAIDVVFHRLKQQGLDELCCLIHDSQTDKKAFVQNLRQTYETWLAEPDGSEAARAARDVTVQTIEREMGALAPLLGLRWKPCRTPAGSASANSFERLIELRAHEPALDARTAEGLPGLCGLAAAWRAVRRLAATLVELGHPPVLAHHPFRWLANAALRAERPLETLGAASNAARDAD